MSYLQTAEEKDYKRVQNKRCQTTTPSFEFFTRPCEDNGNQNNKNVPKQAKKRIK